MNCFVMEKSSDGRVKSSRVEVSCVVIVESVVMFVECSLVVMVEVEWILVESR